MYIYIRVVQFIILEAIKSYNQSFKSKKKIHILKSKSSKISNPNKSSKFIENIINPKFTVYINRQKRNVTDI